MNRFKSKIRIYLNEYNEKINEKNIETITTSQKNSEDTNEYEDYESEFKENNEGEEEEFYSENDEEYYTSTTSSDSEDDNKYLMHTEDKTYLLTNDLINDISDFKINDFIKMYCKRKNKVPSIMRYSKTLNKSFLNLQKSDEEISLKIFKLINNYINGKFVNEQIKDIKNIDNLVLRNKNIINEVYIQLINQITENIDKEGINRGFEILLSFACIYDDVSPSKTLFGYIINFLARNAIKPGYSGLLSYTCLKIIIGKEEPPELTSEYFLNLYNKQLNNTIFNVKLSDVYDTEIKYQFLCQNGLLSDTVGTYGAVSGIGKAFLFLTPYYPPNDIYNTLVNGGYLNTIYYGINEKIPTEKFVCISKLFDTIEFTGVLDNKKINIPLNAFTDVVINESKYYSPKKNNELSFALVGMSKECTMQLIASNVSERNRWVLAFRSYFDWNRSFNNTIDIQTFISSYDENERKADIKDMFINYLSQLLSDPNDYYHQLTHGIKATISLLPNPSSLGTLKVTPTLNNILFQINGKEDININLKDIKSISVSLASNLTSPQVPPARYGGSNIYIEKNNNEIYLIHINSYYYHILWSYMLFTLNEWYKKNNNIIKKLSLDDINDSYNEFSGSFKIKEYELDIPNFIKLIINRLKELNYTHYEGIFRKSASLQIVENNIKLLNQGYYEVLKLCDDADAVAVIASIFKQWLRELSDSIVYKLYYRYLVKIYQ